LEVEHENKPNFKQWWNSKREWVGLKEGEELSDVTDPVRAANIFFDATRNVTIHTRSVHPRAQVGVEVTAQAKGVASMSWVVIRTDGTKERGKAEPGPPAAPEPTNTEPRVEWRWYFEDLPPGVVDAQDVVTLSEEHVGRLEAFVSECESRFAS
jgi:hypothetical protein